MANPAFSGIYGGYKYESSESRALGSITPQSYDYRDQSKLMTKLTGDVSYMAAYMRKMQKGIDSANQNVIQQIQSLIQEIILIFGGDGDTGFDFGDLRYIFAAIGSLFGLQPGLPLPINLFAAAWFFFSNYIIPVDNFSDFLNEFVDSFLATMLDVLGEVPILGEAAQQLAVIISTIRDQLLPILDLIDGLLDAIGNPDLTAWNAFWTSLAPIFDMLTEVFGPYVGPPMAGVVVILSTILTWTEEMIASFGNVVNVFANFVANMSITENIIDTVTQFLSNMVSMLGAITGSTTDYLANTFSPIAGWANIFVAFLTEDVIPSITAAWTGSIAGQVITGALNGLLTVGGVTLNTLFTNINSSGQLVLSGATGALNTAVTIGGTALSTLATNWNAAVTNINNLIGGVTGASTAADVATNINLAATNVNSLISGVSGASTAADVATNINLAATNIAQIGTAAQNAAAGVVGSLNTAATQVQTALSGIPTSLFSLFRGPTATPPPAAVSVDTAASAMETQVSNIIAAQTSLTGLGLPATQSGLRNDLFDFGTFADGALPVTFSVVDWKPFGGMVTGDSDLEVQDGKLAWVWGVASTGHQGRLAISSRETTTDYQEVSGIWSGISDGDNFNYLFARSNSVGTTGVLVILKEDIWIIKFLVDGTVTDFVGSGVGSGWTFKPGAKYTLEAGTENGVRRFRLTENNVPLKAQSGATEFNDLSSVSQYGSGYRRGAAGFQAAGDGSVSPLPMSSFAVADRLFKPGPPATAYVSTQQATSSATYANLATTGPAVTVTIGSSGMALVCPYAHIVGSTIGNTPYMGVDVSGATTLSANDNLALGYSTSSNSGQFAGAVHLYSGLNPGSNTFTSKYRRGGPGGGYFSNRRLAVIPL